MVIDVHIHAFPDKVAAKAMESLKAVYGIDCFSDGTIAGLLANMAESGVDTSIILPVSTDPRQVVSINTWASSLSQTSTFPSEVWRSHPHTSSGATFMPRLIGFGTIHPKFEGYRDEIQRIKELGIKGVKFQPSFQEFYPDDEEMFPVYEELIKAGLVIIFHAGDEIKPARIVYSTPQRLARVLDIMRGVINNYNYYVVNESLPQRPTKIVAAHLGGYEMWDQVEEYLLGRDLFFDVSYVFGHIDFARATLIIQSHGTNKILFGSDFPFARPQDNIQMIQKLDITQQEKKKIFRENALRLLGLNNQPNE